jgi:hypothetical protein
MQRIAFVCAFALAAANFAQANDHDDNRARARLSSFQEVPALASAASGSFGAQIAPTSFSYELHYSGFDTAVTQSHIHFAQKGVNGGIMVFLCSNLGNGPAGTQACPSPGGTVTGTITAASVIGPSGQGVTAGQFDALLKAMRGGVTYANVHSTKFPGGEIRGQIRVDD